MRERVLAERCVSSDSGATVGECWCAECGDVRRDVLRERTVLAIVQVGPMTWQVVTD